MNKETVAVFTPKLSKKTKPKGSGSRSAQKHQEQAQSPSPQEPMSSIAANESKTKKRTTKNTLKPARQTSSSVVIVPTTTTTASSTLSSPTTSKNNNNVVATTIPTQPHNPVEEPHHRSPVATSILTTIAATFHTMRVQDSTIRGYTSKVNRMKQFFAETPGMSHCLSENGDIVLPLKLEELKALFAWLSVNPELSRSGQDEDEEDHHEDAETAEVIEILDHTMTAETQKEGTKKRKIQQPKSTNNKKQKRKKRAKSDEDDDVDEDTSNQSAEDDHDSATEHDFGIDGVDANDYMAANIATMSISAMQGYKSALLWYYDEMKVLMDEENNRWLDDFIRAYKRFVAQKKQNGVMKLTEGKTYIQFQDYIILSEVCNKNLMSFYYICVNKLF
jgi:hypothetical protein